MAERRAGVLAGRTAAGEKHGRWKHSGSRSKNGVPSSPRRRRRATPTPPKLEEAVAKGEERLASLEADARKGDEHVAVLEGEQAKSEERLAKLEAADAKAEEKEAAAASESAPTTAAKK